MDKLFEDVWLQAQSYYDLIVNLIPKLVLGTALFVGFWMLAGYIRKFASNRLKARMEDPLLADFLARVIKISLIILGFLVFLKAVGLAGAASGILAGAGVSAFIIGFAFKDIGENFLAGLLMAFKRPFRIGDVVETGAITGTIVGLNLRDTQIKTFDGKDVYVPNGMIMKNPIINYTIDGYLRQDFVIGVDYDSDLREAYDLILQAVETVNGVLLDNKKPSVAITELGTSTVNFKVFFWIDTFDKTISGLEVKTEAIRKVLATLTDAGHYLPGDVVELKNYHDRGIKTLQDDRKAVN